MKQFIPVVAVSLFCCGLLWGCAQLQAKVGPEAAKAINAYCLQPQSVRLVTREQVNALITPNSVRIDCQGDVE